MKLLTIVLPTYKRCKYVEENVRLLTPQLKKHIDDVSLIVTDNASNDGTSEAIKSLMTSDCDIRYNCHNTNIGAHGNFYWGIENSDSEFVFLLGDDDICSPNFLDCVIPILKDGGDTLGILHFNYMMGAADLKRVSLFNTEINNVELVETYDNPKIFISTHWTGPSFMSSLIFRKSIMEKGKRLNYHEDCYGYDWLLALYTGVMDYKCVYYKIPLLIQRFGGSYSKFALNTVLGQYRLFKYLEDYIPGISNEWNVQVANQRYYNVLDVLLTISHSRNLYKTYYNEMKSSLASRFHKLILYVVTYVPSNVSQLLLKPIAFINRAVRYIKYHH